jgi:hypothetical protein
MKLSAIYYTHPEIFCDLTANQQEDMLTNNGFVVLLHNPLKNWKISVRNKIEDVYSMSGFSAQIASKQSRTLIYWNDSQSIYIELP